MEKLIIDLANKYKMSPDEVLAIESAYDFIGRFAFVKNNEELELCIMEERSGKEFIYRDIPLRVRKIVLESLLKHGPHSISNFYSDQMKPLKFELFLKNMIHNKIQPRDMFESGVITYKHLKYSNSIDKTVEVVVYNAKNASNFNERHIER